MYAHRNGEQETPTELGAYWFTRELPKRPHIVQVTRLTEDVNSITGERFTVAWWGRDPLDDGYFWGPIPEPVLEWSN